MIQLLSARQTAPVPDSWRGSWVTTTQKMIWTSTQGGPIWLLTEPAPQRPLFTLAPSHRKHWIWDCKRLCLKSRKSSLERVSTVRGSGWVNHPYAVINSKYRNLIIDPSATADGTDPLQARRPDS